MTHLAAGRMAAVALQPGGAAANEHEASNLAWHPQSVDVAFISLVLIKFFKAYNYRSDRLSVLQRPFANHWLNLAILWELVLLAVIVYVPFLHGPFGRFSLGAADWVLVVTLALTVVPVLEAVKWMERHGPRARHRAGQGLVPRPCLDNGTHVRARR